MLQVDVQKGEAPQHIWSLFGCKVPVPHYIPGKFNGYWRSESAVALERPWPTNGQMWEDSGWITLLCLLMRRAPAVEKQLVDF